MLNNGEAGIDCTNCGYTEIVRDEGAMEEFKNLLRWDTEGSPVCPGCGLTVTFEDYLD